MGTNFTQRLSRADSILKLVKTAYATTPSFNQTTFFGVPHNYKDIKTLRDLLEINYKYQPVKNQLR